MSGFCVFGMTRQLAQRMAESAMTRATAPKGGWTRDSWREAVEAKAAQICSDAKPRQISPAFDAPQFAAEWIEVARRTGQLIAGSIMARGKKVDRKGADVINKRTGQPAETWVPCEYVPHD